MNKELLLQKIKKKAEQDRKKRQDPRFLNTMGFLVAKGFLKTNFSVHLCPNLRLRVEDAVWAGENVEPRILEVLPAAVLRLGKHFDLNRKKHPALAVVVDQLRRREQKGEPFCGMPYEKLKIWADFPLLDKRVKGIGERKLTKTFRLDPEVADRLKALATKENCTETEVLERLVRNVMKSLAGIVLFMTTGCLLLATDANSASSSEAIRGVDFKRYLLATEAFRSCPEIVKESCSGRMDIDYCPAGLKVSVAYTDLTGDGLEEAIVLGSSCYTGTAGPDIHSVYQIDVKGEVHELSVPTAEKKVYGSLFGNTNYVLRNDGSRLIAEYTDTSGRDHPLVVKYIWGQGGFKVDRIEASPIYRTSYECSKAKTEQERAICYVKNLADLDLKLDRVYKQAINRSELNGRSKIVRSQREWITTRDENCPIYKWWVECLQKAYQERIKELEK
jgi:uncharacterized protein YecT (DUF1311 family)